jgi:hypothetical protein
VTNKDDKAAGRIVWMFIFFMNGFAALMAHIVRSYGDHWSSFASLPGLALGSFVLSAVMWGASESARS